MRLLRERSVFYKYVLSYSTVVLVACTVLGLLFFLYSSHELQKSNLQIARNKLDILGGDLNSQYDIMEKIAVDIRFSEYFRSSFIERHKYNELEMLEQLIKYQGYSPVVDKFFLLISNNDMLYTGEGTVIDARTLFSVKLKITDWEPVYGQLTKMLGFEQTGLLEHRDYLLFVFPVRDGNSYTFSKSVVFVVPKEALLKRFEFLIGAGNTDFKVHSKIGTSSQEIILSRSMPSAYGAEYELFSSALGSKFQISVERSALSDIAVIRQYRTYFIFIFISILLVLLLFGTTIAYNNYKPIRQLLMRLSGNATDDRRNSNELHKIENLFQAKRVEESYRKEQFENQLHTLREHMADLVRHAVTMRTRQQSEWLLHLTRMLKENNAAGAKQLLNTRIAEFSEGVLSLYPKKLLFADVLMALLSLADEQEINFSQQWLESSLEAETTEAFLVLVEPMLEELADGILRKKQDEKAHVADSIVSFIRNHCCEYDMSLEYLSERFSIHTSQLSRMLKEECGISFKDFLVDLRMEKAKYYLLSTELPISEIALKVGYSSPSHFIKIFKKATGNVPTFYRSPEATI